MEIFAVKWNVVSEASKILLNDIYTELDGSSGIKSIITDRLSLGELQVDIFSIFLVRIVVGGYQQFFDCRSCMFSSCWVS